MNGTKPTILMVEDNSHHVSSMHTLLSEVDIPEKRVAHVISLGHAVEYLSRYHTDIVLLSLSLRSSSVNETLEHVRQWKCDVPTVLLAPHHDSQLALRAIQMGAQDFLVKGGFDANRLETALRFALERHRQVENLREQSLMDRLTGICNRYRFETLARQQLKLSARTGHRLILLYVDVDNLKWVNDNFGHKEGDQLLQDTANILKGTFRGPDIIGRLGGDEFAVMAIDTADIGQLVLISRLRENLDRFNADSGRPVKLSLSVGAAGFNPDKGGSLEELMESADKLMYQQKEIKKRGPDFPRRERVARALKDTLHGKNN